MTEATPLPATGPRTRVFVDLHCHTSASFDSLSSPESVVRAASSRGLTHLAITDHDRIDGALEARDRALELRARSSPGAGVTVIVGEEIRTRDGDLVAVHLAEAVPPGLSAAETIAAIREQGGLVGIPHPFDRTRGGSLARTDDQGALESLAGQVDWIETWNARVMFGSGNERATALAAAAGVAGVAVSDAHTTMEIGIAATILAGDPSTPEGLRAALAGERELVIGHASIYVRLVTPAAKVIQRLRGNGRVRPSSGLLRAGGGR
jgi:predicted metal-dependent phosphoesterase TrpH